MISNSQEKWNFLRSPFRSRNSSSSSFVSTIRLHEVKHSFSPEKKNHDEILTSDKKETSKFILCVFQFKLICWLRLRKEKSKQTSWMWSKSECALMIYMYIYATQWQILPRLRCACVWACWVYHTLVHFYMALSMSFNYETVCIYFFFMYNFLT